MNARCIARAKSNSRILGRFTLSRISQAIAAMESQSAVDIWIAQLVSAREVVAKQLVFERDALGRWRVLAGVSAASVALSTWAGIAVFPRLMDENAHSLGTSLMLGGTVALCVVSGMLLVVCVRARVVDELPDVRLTDIQRAHQTRAAAGETHKRRVPAWQRFRSAATFTGEVALGVYLALVTLKFLPAYVALVAGIAGGVVFASAIGRLARLQARLAVIDEGRESYRELAGMANLMKQRGDPRSGEFQDKADAMRAALEDANGKTFAKKARRKVAGLWVLLGVMVVCLFVLRVLLNIDVTLSVTLGALVLALMSLAVFAANYADSKAEASVAGDTGAEAMRIADTFRDVQAYIDAVDLHEAWAEREFDHVANLSAEAQELKLKAQDPAIEPVRFDFRMPRLVRAAAAMSAYHRTPVSAGAPPPERDGSSPAQHETGDIVVPAGPVTRPPRPNGRDGGVPDA
jgi:hypothetical protein